MLKPIKLFLPAIILFSCGQPMPVKKYKGKILNDTSVTQETTIIDENKTKKNQHTKKNDFSPVFYLNDKIYSTKPIKYPENYLSDSVILKNEGRFGKVDYDDGTKLKSAAIFKLTITNKGRIPILDFNAARDLSLQININGDPNACFMTLANHMVMLSTEGHPQFNLLATDSSDTSFDLDFSATEETIKYYGKVLTCQWIYMGEKSKILEANLVTKTIREVNKHVSFTEVADTLK